MAEKISDYTADNASNPLKNADLLDVSNEDGGGVGTCDVSKKITVEEFIAFANANGLNIYVKNGSITGDRDLTADTFYTRWTGGDVQVAMADEINDYGFKVLDVSLAEKARLSYDQATLSGFLRIKNASGNFFVARDGTFNVNTDILYVDEDSVGFGTNTPDSDYVADMGGILGIKEYTVATLPTVPSSGTGMIAVTDETGGHTLAFSDGTNWRRVQDRAIVS